MKSQAAEIQHKMQISCKYSALDDYSKCYSSSNIQYLENDNKLLNYAKTCHSSGHQEIGTLLTVARVFGV